MHSQIKHSDNQLHIFHEGRTRRVFVGELIYLSDSDRYELIYNKNYIASKNAIAISPDLDLLTISHMSKKGELFPVFIDRIPLKTNPAYEDYCFSQEISLNEKNPIILLGTIGKRGPSSFVFELVYKNEFSHGDIIKFREKLKITQHDFSQAFDISKVTLQKIESGKSKDVNALKRLQIYFEFPEVALWQLKQTGERIHSRILSKLLAYFRERIGNA